MTRQPNSNAGKIRKALDCLGPHASLEEVAQKAGKMSYWWNDQKYYDYPMIQYVRQVRYGWMVDRKYDLRRNPVPVEGCG